MQKVLLDEHNKSEMKIIQLHYNWQYRKSIFAQSDTTIGNDRIVSGCGINLANGTDALTVVLSLQKLLTLLGSQYLL